MAKQRPPRVEWSHPLVIYVVAGRDLFIQAGLSVTRHQLYVQGSNWKQLKTNEVCFLEKGLLRRRIPALTAFLHHLQFQALATLRPGVKEVRRGVIDNWATMWVLGTEPGFSARADHRATEREVIRGLVPMLRLCHSRSRQWPCFVTRRCPLLLWSKGSPTCQPWVTSEDIRVLSHLLATVRLWPTLHT